MDKQMELSNFVEDKAEALVAHIHAGCVELAFKVHDETHESWQAAYRIARIPAVKKVLNSEIFQNLRRCEPNYNLDSGTLHLLEVALHRSSLTRIKMVFVKVIICPSNGMLSTLERAYQSLPSTMGRKDIWSEDVNEFDLLEALRSLKLDSAYAGMRRTFFHAEDKRQKRINLTKVCDSNSSTSDDVRQRMKQKRIFSKYFVSMQKSGAFDRVLQELIGQRPESQSRLLEVLRSECHVKSRFHIMLLCRDLSLLFQDSLYDASSVCTASIYVGGGAVRTVQEAVGATYNRGTRYKQSDLLQKLHVVHKSVLEKLDMSLVAHVCPRGWDIDLTEHAACEKRKFDEACEAVALGKTGMKRRCVRNLEHNHHQRASRLEGICWSAVGFRKRPRVAKFSVRQVALLRARHISLE